LAAPTNLRERRAKLAGKAQETVRREHRESLSEGHLAGAVRGAANP